QDARLLPWKRVIDNVGLGLSGDWRPRADQALAEVGLAERADEWPAALSGGQKQRVALARALIHQPRLLLLDEPLGALDALTRIEMQHLIERLWLQHGFTVLLVTHDVSEAVAVADRVILIEDGAIGLDLAVDLPRPRNRGSATLAALEARVLDRVLQRPPLAERPEPVTPLPTQLRCALWACSSGECHDHQGPQRPRPVQGHHLGTRPRRRAVGNRRAVPCRHSHFGDHHPLGTRCVA